MWGYFQAYHFMRNSVGVFPGIICKMDEKLIFYTIFFLFIPKPRVSIPQLETLNTTIVGRPCFCRLFYKVRRKDKKIRLLRKGVSLQQLTHLWDPTTMLLNSLTLWNLVVSYPCTEFFMKPFTEINKMENINHLNILKH